MLVPLVDYPGAMGYSFLKDITSPMMNSFPAVRGSTMTVVNHPDSGSSALLTAKYPNPNSSDRSISITDIVTFGSNEKRPEKEQSVSHSSVLLVHRNFQHPRAELTSFWVAGGYRLYRLTSSGPHIPWTACCTMQNSAWAFCHPTWNPCYMAPHTLWPHHAAIPQHVGPWTCGHDTMNNTSLSLPCYTVGDSWCNSVAWKLCGVPMSPEPSNYGLSQPHGPYSSASPPAVGTGRRSGWERGNLGTSAAEREQKKSGTWTRSLGATAKPHKGCQLDDPALE